MWLYAPRATPLARHVFRPFQLLLSKSDLPRIRFHDLRHMAATLPLPRRVVTKVVSKMLGHSTVASTLNIHRHAPPDMQDDAAAILEQLLYTSSPILSLLPALGSVFVGQPLYPTSA